MYKKGLALAIVILFFGAGIVSAFNVTLDNEPKPLNRGNWLYVGGSGPGNYSNIPEAMENATDGDTIFVYSGIYGTLTIRKSLNIIGENKYTTILNGSGASAHDAVAIEANNVNLSGFTIQNGGNPDLGYYGRGISLQSRSDVIVSDVILTHNYLGIIHYWNTNVLLENLTFINKGGGISFWDGKNCTITHCIFDNAGISHNGFGGGGALYIRYNVFTNNSIINLGPGCIDTLGNTTIEGNNFLNNSLAIRTYNCKGVYIANNNFIGNTLNAELSRESFFREIRIYTNYKQYWMNNYWDDWNQNGSYSITGIWTLDIGIPFPFHFQWILIPILILKIHFKEYDYNPAKEPYDIS